MTASDVVTEFKQGECWLQASMTLDPALKSPQLLGRRTWEELDANKDCPTTEAQQSLPVRATEAVSSCTVASALCSLMSTLSPEGDYGRTTFYTM